VIEEGRAMRDRRPRLPANDRVMIEGFDAPAWAINWSPDGCCIVSERAVREGESLCVELPERYARAEAKVVWSRIRCDGCLAGLEFLALDRRAISTRVLVR
jgi:hypothetical protein